MTRDTRPNTLARLLLVLAFVSALAAGRALFRAYADTSPPKYATEATGDFSCCEVSGAEGDQNACCQSRHSDGEANLCCPRKPVEATASPFSETQGLTKTKTWR